MVTDQQMLQCDPMLPMESKWKSNVEIAPNCPRCASPNTKFCYYNKYSLSQRSSSSNEDSGNRSDIDLAVVFTNFLNQNSSFDQPEPNEDNNSSMECQKPDVHSIQEPYRLREMPEIDEIEAFGLQSLLAAEDQVVLLDGLWTGHDVTATTADFEWQMQQLKSFPVDGQLKFSANLINEDWGSFDHSGFGIF
ncbi:hypothetical protein F3Y22_tig00111095pilonHSYRG00758 [Hibiscus syriacus]|uniref:Dof-type domain-containing protein n=1 Tax=Hibiscus syriacus TaxID=106335 RepID=A0A6A2Z1C7_HIBSY|nr:hypothetical protein F3Y22_tig00111095pilonHSYRG00758 [Hibiscus syriacus]